MIKRTFFCRIFNGVFVASAYLSFMPIALGPTFPTNLSLGVCGAAISGPKVIATDPTCMKDNDLARFVINGVDHSGRCVSNERLGGDLVLCMSFPDIGDRLLFIGFEFNKQSEVNKTFARRFADGNGLQICDVNLDCTQRACTEERKTILFLEGELLNAKDILNECLRRE